MGEKQSALNVLEVIPEGKGSLSINGRMILKWIINK
jgi:hypothetical protein